MQDLSSLLLGLCPRRGRSAPGAFALQPSRNPGCRFAPEPALPLAALLATCCKISQPSLTAAPAAVDLETLLGNIALPVLWHALNFSWFSVFNLLQRCFSYTTLQPHRCEVLLQPEPCSSSTVAALQPPAGAAGKSDNCSPPGTGYPTA